MAFVAVNLFSFEYVVDSKAKNVVKFYSKASVEEFEGVSSKIDGYIYSEKNELQNADVYFEVDLNLLDTGIGLRNRHMREDYLHTDKYPKTHFKGKITEINKISDTEFDVKANGTYFLHGISQNRQISGKIYLMDNSMKLKSEFIVKLTDHNVEIPKFMFLKISENIKVYVDFISKKVK